MSAAALKVAPQTKKNAELTTAFGKFHPGRWNASGKTGGDVNYMYEVKVPTPLKGSASH